VSGELLAAPDKGGGLFDVFRHRDLLRLIVRKELKVRYRSSVLGLLWSYVKPGVQFVVSISRLGSS
jgi:ABC-2 type transport system permease protein